MSSRKVVDQISRGFIEGHMSRNPISADARVNLPS
jgi:hypothetical protein